MNWKAKFQARGGPDLGTLEPEALVSGGSSSLVLSLSRSLQGEDEGAPAGVSVLLLLPV